MDKIKLDIKKRDLVLEIGSGHFPYNRSNILCDRFLFSNKQRSESVLRYDRPLVIANGEELPFKNNVFDFVICRQVIEHSDNPIKFAREMERVGKRGLIVCPNAVRESIFGWKNHKWWITSENDSGRLIFRPKKKAKESTAFHKLFKEKVFFRRFCRKNEDFLNIYLYWSKNVNISVLDKTEQDFLEKVKLKAQNLTSNVKPDLFPDLCFLLKELYLRTVNKVKKEFKVLGWKIKQFFNRGVNLEKLKYLIVCPECKNRLLFSGKLIKCRECRAVYGIINNIPIFLSKKEKKKGL